MSEIMEVGNIVSGTVINVKPYGVFVSVGDMKGLVHISQVSKSYVKDINEIISSGDKVNVKILSMEEGKIALSIKDVPEDMVIQKEEVHEVKDVRDIKVTHKCFANKERMQEKKDKTFDELMKDFNRQSNDRIVDINKRLKNR